MTNVKSTTCGKPARRHGYHLKGKSSNRLKSASPKRIMRHYAAEVDLTDNSGNRIGSVKCDNIKATNKYQAASIAIRLVSETHEQWIHLPCRAVATEIEIK